MNISLSTTWHLIPCFQKARDEVFVADDADLSKSDTQQELISNSDRSLLCRVCNGPLSSDLASDHCAICMRLRPLGSSSQSREPHPTSADDQYLRHQAVPPLEQRNDGKICDESYASVHPVSHFVERPFKCDNCSLTFKHLANLQDHARVHKGHRLHICPVCCKTFLGKSCLKRHQRVHTGERPFVCQFCNKGFTQLSNLREHERIHTGVHPFTCEICGKAFKQSSGLRAHSQRHEVDQSLPTVSSGNVVWRPQVKNCRTFQVAKALYWFVFCQEVATGAVKLRYIDRALYSRRIISLARWSLHRENWRS